MRTRSGFTQQGQRLDQRGVTIIEALIVVAVTGLIIAPLAGVFINGLTNSARSHERLLDNGSAQRVAEAWTKDVQSVDPHGVGQGLEAAATACVDPSVDVSTAPPELVRVTFNWDLEAGGDDLPKTATWALVDEGDSVTLVRRYCEDGFRGEGVMARGLDLFSKSTAHGPEAPDVFCPVDANGVARTCTLVIPELDLDLTVTRRVPNYDANTLPTGAPPPPAIFAHDARYQYLNVRFKPSVPQPVTSYRLELRKGSPTAPPIPTQTKTVTVTQPVPAFYQVTFSGLDVQAVGGPPVNYYVTAVAINDMGPGTQSDPYGPMNPQPTGPDAPTTPEAARLSNGCVRVTWSANAQNGGSPRTGFRVWAYEALSDTDPFVDGTTALIDMDPIPADTTTPPPTSYDFCNGLSPFSRYRFVVADKNAVDIGLKSAPSNLVMAYTAGTRFVNTSGSDSGNDCVDPSAPCATIQRAVDVSTAGNPVAVAKGNYARFVINNKSVTLVGGFDNGFSEITPLTASTPEAETTRVTAGAQLSPAAPPVASTNTAISVRAVSAATTIRNVAVRQTNVSSTTSTSGIEVHSSGNPVWLDTVRTVGGNSSLNPTGLLVSGASPVSVTSSWIDSGSPDTGAAGSSAYGVRAVSGANVSLSATTVTAASGRPGSNGADGSTSNGCTGLDGGSTDSTSSGGSGGGSCGGGAGAGGSGAVNSGSTGNSGSNASGTGGGAKGTGGGGNSSCGGDAYGGNGGSGATSGGTAGTVGQPGAASEGALWVGATGGNGTNGSAGKGGGGAGGGGSGRNNKFIFWGCDENRPGGGGGGGGGAGGAGTAATGGTAGGGSFGVYAFDATVTVQSASAIEVGDGGDGGDGGRGGNGGRGGEGGKGGSGKTDEGGPGGGGGGGSGGGAGGSGAGGQGGPSVAVFFARSAGNSTAPPQIDGSTSLSRGTGGAAGAGGGATSGGSGGSRGDRGTTSGNSHSGNYGTAGASGAGLGAAPDGSGGPSCAVLDRTKAPAQQCTA
ncbi:MAG: fibronectin type III domain-containing protein [Microthrixaceae bacterium]|nr:fibronectin type III domain-containing protein [Microthrixaceae bacterium]